MKKKKKKKKNQTDKWIIMGHYYLLSASCQQLQKLISLAFVGFETMRLDFELFY